VRAVLDAGVFVSSFFGGNPRAVIDLWKTGTLTLCLSQDILDVYIDVLRRLGLDSAPELDELLTLFAAGSHILFTVRTPEVRVVADPDDDRFVACALALAARCIVTGDRSLLDVHGYEGITVVTPRAFLDIMRDPAP
jgi:putative PIN family toxin of toxin-antitoxin system